MKNKILILGAGVYQLPLINRCKERGYEVHVASIKGNYPGINAADFFHEINILDAEKIINLAKKKNYIGVLTCGTDICMPTIGQVNDTLKLSGVNYNSALASTDKILMKKTLRKNKIPSPEFKIIKEINQAYEFFNKIGKSCIIKPTNSSGSRGVSKVTNIYDIVASFISAKKYSEEVIIEEWLEGMEFGAQVIVKKDSDLLVMIHSDELIQSPTPIPVGHGAPHPRINEISKDTINIIKQVITAFNLDSCIVNVDMIWHQNSPQIIELGARMGATCLPEVCGSWWGINLYDIAIDLAIGKDIVNLPEEPKGESTFAHLLWSEKDGIVHDIPDISDEFTYNLDIDKGDEVFRFASGNKRLGDILKSGRSIEKITREVTNEAKEFNKKLGVKK